MKSKLKMVGISFILLILVEIIISPDRLWQLGMGNSHVGLLFVVGLIFGPYGALGATLGNIILDYLSGFELIEILPSAIFSFGISYLAYKLWYSGFKTKKITKPKLDNIYHLSLFLSSIFICGFIYSVVHGDLINMIACYDKNLSRLGFIIYFLNFVNFAFIFGIVSIWISKKIDFMEIPKISKRNVNVKLYQALFVLLIIVTIISFISIFLNIDENIMIGEILLIGILLFSYLTKPFKFKIQETGKNTVTENIIKNFIILTLTIAILGIIISILSYNFVMGLENINPIIALMPGILITDAIIIMFFVPGIIILKYIENKVITPISSFSEIEGFIKENEKIESEGLIEIYSKYINEKNEIETLARSYTDLINHNNNYIENIREIEVEKERINTELNIATKIQTASLPKEPIENDDFFIDGYCHPAKEVGGDFFDYYMIDDDNLAIVIGDASGKGVPAALIAMISQVMIKETLKHYIDPSKILYMLNNHLCENNFESMFITLWFGIYNTKTKKLTFSNAGHNPPIIKEYNEFKLLTLKYGIVLGVLEDFEYTTEEISLKDEIILYTDGITDANNKESERYGENRLLKFFNEFESDENPIAPLLKDIRNFAKDAEQFDDMTISYLRIK